ncbi:MAG: flavodoxin domain-containing protein [Oscillospiraceae bacterium]
MKKTAVVFWSGTGNTESMANAVLEGMKAAGAEAELFTSEQADAAKLALFDAIAFGCPAMGAEELEETEFAPMFDAVKGSLSGKDAALFGSYGWGDGVVRTWRRLQGNGMKLVRAASSAAKRPTTRWWKTAAAWRRAGKIK